MWSFLLFAVIPAVLGEEKCEEISIPMCKEIGYNRTRLPNQFNHATQEEAGLEVHQFWPLVKIECSADLRFFLCSMYTPICIDTYPKPIPACRSVCERAREGCLPVMQKYGFQWPSRMSCSLLPSFGGPELCMDDQAKDPPGSGRGMMPSSPRRPSLSPAHVPGLAPGGPQLSGTPGGSAGSCSCPTCHRESFANMVVPLRPGDRLYSQNVSWAGQANCAAPCYSPYFNPQDREYTELWLSVWAIVCCISTAVSFSTFLLDPARYHYPERAIMYLSLCYFFIGLGFIIRISVGHQALSCTGQRPEQEPGFRNLLVSRANIPSMESDTGDLLCTAVFVLIYFFSMASSMWWIVLTLTWFLAAGLKWAGESISSYSLWYHLVVWGIPLIKTTLLLALSAVEGENVAGICTAGARDTGILIGFVLVPLATYLLIGITFLCCGFISLFKIRRLLRQEAGQGIADKLEKLMVKIGIFGILYIVPAGTVIACGVYEAWNQKTWEQNYLCQSCQDSVNYPDFSIFMLKYFMQLAVGVTAGFWVWSGKTIVAWQAFAAKLFNLRRFTKNINGGGGGSKPGMNVPLPPLPRTIQGGPSNPVDNHYSTIPRRTELTQI